MDGRGVGELVGGGGEGGGEGVALNQISELLDVLYCVLQDVHLEIEGQT